MIKELEELPYFTLANLAFYLKDKKNAGVYASNWMKKKKLYRIRDGVYISDEKLKVISASGKMNSYNEYIATNLIYTPSYLSLEYILSENGILSENVYNFTLVSTKKTAKFENYFWKFIYRSIKDNFFWDYTLIEKDGFIIYKATPEKALFDWFYFKRGIVWEESYFKELRLNMENVHLGRFERLTRKYKSKKIDRVFIFLKKLKWSEKI